MGALSLLLGGVACKQEQPAQPPPVVVAPVKPSAGNNIRICPKCYRRFFGGQSNCTVDGTALIEYGSGQADLAQAPVPTPAAGAGLTDAGAAPADTGAGQPATGGTVAVASLPKTGEPAAQPVRVLGTDGGTSAQDVPPAGAPSRPPVQPWTPAPERPAAAPVKPVGAPSNSNPPPVANPPQEKVANVPAPTPPPAKPAPVAKPAVSAEQLAAQLLADKEGSSALAQKGKLTAEQLGALAAVPVRQEDQYSASRSLLAMHYRARNSQAEYGKALEELLSIPSNQYNPTIRLEQAEYFLLNKRYQEALDSATIAERYRQKFPQGDVYYTRLARTYEVMAKAYEGRFTQSEDPDDLDLAIRMWQRYLTHVEQKQDQKRIEMARESISKLERIKERTL